MAQRGRGNIEHRGNALRVRVSAGKDPLTGDRLMLKETVSIEKPGNARSEQAAWKQAQKVLTKLQAEADSLRVARTKATVGALLDKWLPQHELDVTTRMNYESQIRNYIKPALGEVPLALLVRETSSRLEPFYTDLRRCRQRQISDTTSRRAELVHAFVDESRRGMRYLVAAVLTRPRELDTIRRDLRSLARTAPRAFPVRERLATSAPSSRSWRL